MGSSSSNIGAGIINPVELKLNGISDDINNSHHSPCLFCFKEIWRRIKMEIVVEVI